MSTQHRKTEFPQVITDKILMAKKKELGKYLEEVKKPFHDEWAAWCREFCKQKSPIKRNKVYELVENGKRARGYKRFSVYAIEMTLGFKSPMIRVAGWWLDDNNVPAKWDGGMIIYGVGNPAVFKLSDNQKQNPVPKHLHHLCKD